MNRSISLIQVRSLSLNICSRKYNEEHQATVIISSHNLNHTVDVCPRIALLEHGVIIRDIINEDNSAEKELEDYFNVEEE